MDVYNLINSKTISKYCRKIKHQFNTLETGVLIHRCKTISIDKKIEYYNEIINNPALYPDMAVPKQRLKKQEVNAIDLIQIEVDMLNFSIELFHKPDKDAVFILEVLSFSEQSGRGEWRNQNPIFKTLHDINNYIEKEIIIEDYYIGYRIRKKYLNKNYEHIALTYRRNDKNDFELFNTENTTPWKHANDIMDVEYYGLHFIWINIPNPFKKGDIITTDGKIAVVTWLCNKDPKYIERVITSGFGDSSDMCCSGYYYCECAEKIVLDHLGVYDEFEYYTDELKGFDRIFKAISSLTKQKIDIDLFFLQKILKTI